MQNFTRRLLTEWRKLELPFENQTFIAAVSGGADSCALALALHDLFNRKKLRNKFVIAHYNHNLRGAESDADERFVQQLAENLSFEFTSEKNKSTKTKSNLEESARDARYAFLQRTVEKHDACAILTAHTLNDQAETFLLNLIRGSGLKGLGAMKTIRRSSLKVQDSEIIEKSQTLLIRPLLTWAKREDTENFARDNKIEFRRDQMNEDLNFRRVRIRKEILPILRELNPKIMETLAKTAFLLNEDFAELENCAREQISGLDLSLEAAELHLKNVKTVSTSLRRQILRNWLAEQRDDLRRLELKHYEAIENLIFSRKSGKIVELPNGETIEKGGGKLIFVGKNIER